MNKINLKLILILLVVIITVVIFNISLIEFKILEDKDRNEDNILNYDTNLSRNNKNEVQIENVKLIIIEEKNADANLQYDIDLLAKKCRQEILELESYFNYKYQQLITVKLHNGSFLAYGHLFVSGGYAKSDESLIEYNLTPYTVNNGIGKHEFIHLFLASKHGNSKSRLMNEGFAVAVEDILDGVSYQRKSIKENLNIVRLLNLETLVNNEQEVDEIEFYPNAGRFVKWVIEEYGIEFAENIYRETLRKHISIELIANTLNISIEDLISKYNYY